MIATDLEKHGNGQCNLLHKKQGRKMFMVFSTSHQILSFSIVNSRNWNSDGACGAASLCRLYLRVVECLCLVRTRDVNLQITSRHNNPNKHHTETLSPLLYHESGPTSTPRIVTYSTIKESIANRSHPSRIASAK